MILWVQSGKREKNDILNIFVVFKFPSGKKGKFLAELISNISSSSTVLL